LYGGPGSECNLDILKVGDEQEGGRPGPGSRSDM
jgi:hypothetical protein